MRQQVLFTSVALIAGVALAHEGATGIVAERMEAMKNMARGFKAIADMLAGVEPFNPEAAATQASIIHENCHRVEAMFPTGSIDHHSKALPRIWEEPEKFQEEMQRLHSATEALAATAGQGDPAAIQEVFDRVQQSCSTCHKLFKAAGS